MPEQAGLYAHQLRGNEESGRGTSRNEDAIETFYLCKQSQHLRRHQGEATLSGDQRGRYTEAKYRIRTQQVGC